MTRQRYEDRLMSRLQRRRPTTVRFAAKVIVVVTVVVVVVSGILMRLLDGDEYPNIWNGMWWATQTVTTVGYGDVTPETTSGRIVAVFVMLEGVAVIAVATAAITSIFVAQARQERTASREMEETGSADAIHARFDALDDRIGRIEAMLSRSEDQ